MPHGLQFGYIILLIHIALYFIYTYTYLNLYLFNSFLLIFITYYLIIQQFNTNIIKKQVRTYVVLVGTLIPSSVKYFVYMEGTGPCDSSKIICGNTFKLLLAYNPKY